MSEMVERVAKAAYESLFDGNWPDVGTSIDADGFRTAARAAIAAMREPTTEIIKAHHIVPDDSNFDQRAADNWRHLIDAGLGIIDA